MESGNKTCICFFSLTLYKLTVGEVVKSPLVHSIIIFNGEAFSYAILDLQAGTTESRDRLTPLPTALYRSSFTYSSEMWAYAMTLNPPQYRV